MKKSLVAVLTACASILLLPAILLAIAVVVIGVSLSLIFAVAGIAASLISMLLGLVTISILAVPGATCHALKLAIDPELRAKVFDKVQKAKEEAGEPPSVKIRGLM